MADDDPIQDGGDPSALTAAYERLRTAVLSGGASAWRLGHGVLSARGMTAWMGAFGSLLAPAPPADGAHVVGDAPIEPISSREADKVVAVLCQMVLPLAA